ncbi:hypothetical protein [Salinivirga cyanobacteriivorans]
MGKYVKLFANCVPVKGKQKALIYDLQREKLHAIPLSFYELIGYFERYPIEEIYNELKGQRETLDKYFNFLEKQDLINYCTEETKDLFQPLPKFWDSYSLCQNLVVELSKENFNNRRRLEQVIKAIKCENITLYITENTDYIDYSSLKEWIQTIDGLHNLSICITTCEFEKNIIEEFKNLKIFNSIIAYDTNIEMHNEKCFVMEDDQKPLVMPPNINLYMESQFYHPYYNGRVVVDFRGRLKNNLLSSEDFGQIFEINNSEELKSIIQSEQFRKLAAIKRDLIDDCKHCEYRYCCMSPNLPRLTSTGLKLSKPCLQ